MRKVILGCMSLLLVGYAQAQVGVGTILPTSELEIGTTNTGFPALELNPQSAPTGTATGQLAVIGDKLFMYDNTRGKWLSVESTALQYGYAEAADDQVLFFGGDVGLDAATDDDSGAKMPLAGTIVYATIQSSGGNATKTFDLKLNGTAVGNSGDPTIDGRITLAGGAFSYSDFNIDFDAGDYITIEARNAAGAVNDPVAIIWVKWRE